MAHLSLRRQVVVITGASSGIGRATALAFAQEGCDVVLAARRMHLLETVRAEVEKKGARALAVACDVTSDTSVANLAQQVDEAFGWVSILVNNAGIGLYGPLESCSEAQLHQLFEVNVHGLTRVTRAMLPLLRRQRDSQIINISSVLGHRALPYLGGYAATKAAVNALTESLRLELKAQGVDVLLVSPGVTATEFGASRMQGEGYVNETPPVKAMSPERVARAIVQSSREKRRDRVLTLPGLFMAYGNRVSPRLVDFVAKRFVGTPERSQS